MQLNIETFSNVRGGNAFFKAVTHPLAAEKGRALFARLILQDAATILLDEPLAAVDEQTAQVLLQQMMRWHQDGRTVIAVLHDLDMVRRWFPAAVVLARRCIAWGPTESALATEAA